MNARGCLDDVNAVLSIYRFELGVRATRRKEVAIPKKNLRVLNAILEILAELCLCTLLWIVDSACRVHAHQSQPGDRRHGARFNLFKDCTAARHPIGH